MHAQRKTAKSPISTCLLIMLVSAVSITAIVNAEIISLHASTEDILQIYKDKPRLYRQAMAAGAKIVNLPKYETFFVYWLPDDFATLKEKEILVVLHGSNGNAYQPILDLCSIGNEEKFGIVSIQWGWPSDIFKEMPGERIAKWEPMYRYFDPDVIYEIMSTAVEYMAQDQDIDIHRCAWYGFDKSAGQGVLHAFYDTYTGNDYFRLFISASGGIDLTAPLIGELKEGAYGATPLKETHFYLWAGSRDGDMSSTMMQSKEIIESLGGAVPIFRVGEEGHEGFNEKRKHQLEAVTLWRDI